MQKEKTEEITYKIFYYNTVPHTTTGVAPADILFWYKIPNGIPTNEKFEPTKQNKTINSRMY